LTSDNGHSASDGWNFALQQDTNTWGRGRHDQRDKRVRRQQSRAKVAAASGIEVGDDSGMHCGNGRTSRAAPLYGLAAPLFFDHLARAGPRRGLNDLGVCASAAVYPGSRRRDDVACVIKAIGCLFRRLIPDTPQPSAIGSARLSWQSISRRWFTSVTLLHGGWPHRAQRRSAHFHCATQAVAAIASRSAGRALALMASDPKMPARRMLACGLFATSQASRILNSVPLYFGAR